MTESDIDNLAGFLRGFTPRSVCAECLASLMNADAASVTEHVNTHTVGASVEASQGECLNCRETRTVYRSRGG